MDQKLLDWARAVKSRRRFLPGPKTPVLWLFTDATRAPDPLPLAACLPKNLCGIIFRHDSAPDRAQLGRALAKLCRARRLALSVAGDWRLAAALGAAQHVRLSQHERPRGNAPNGFTAAAHNRAELRRGAKWGAAALFLSPVLPTASHPGAKTLSPKHFSYLTITCRTKIWALGGIDGTSAKRLPRQITAGAGAIGALKPRATS